MPCLAEARLGQRIIFAGIEQRLGGNAADVQAGAAQRSPAIDANDLHAKLGGADASDISTRSGPNHGQIKTARHENLQALRTENESLLRV